MLLWTRKQLCYARRESFGEDGIFTSKLMEANKEHQDFNQVVKERDLLICEILYCGKKSAV